MPWGNGFQKHRHPSHGRYEWKDGEMTDIEKRIKLMDDVLLMVRNEVERAIRKHKPMNSPHEGYAVIAEELDELWEDVRADAGRAPDRGIKEAVQVAAMGVRYVMDLAP